MPKTNYIDVTYQADHDKFVVCDPDTGKTQTFNSAELHDPLRFIGFESVKNFFCEAFPGKTEWICDKESMTRIESITDFNCLSDEVTF